MVMAMCCVVIMPAAASRLRLRCHPDLRSWNLYPV